MKNKIKKEIFRYKIKKEIQKIRDQHQFCIVFISVPTHGNLGDQAIIYAQYKMFEQIGLIKNIIEIRSCDYIRFADVLEDLLTYQDIIIIDGGGNMGTLWIEEEYKIRDIIQRFKNNKIVIFPETVYYSKDEFGKNELELSKPIYENHKDLHICVRDRSSLELLTSQYKNLDVKYTPDIVLFLDKSPNKILNRQNALCCLRKDKEKVTSDETLKFIEEKLFEYGLKINYTSTVIEENVKRIDREKVLLRKWEEFQKSKIVITDRLHGMIFAAITGTPCIALNNCNGKVKGVYEWIKYLPYIIFCEDLNELSNSIDYLLKLEVCKYNNNLLMKDFDSIIKLFNSSKEI